MRKLESLSLKYAGYKDPQTKEEAELEILGLETAITAAQQRIAVLKQSVRLTELTKNSVAEDTPNAQTVAETTVSTEKDK
jgi:hypothetical protein